MELQVAGITPEALYNFCRERPGGVTKADLAALGWTDQGQLLAAANHLLTQGLLAMHQLGGNQLMFHAVEQGRAAKFRGLDQEHRLVFQMIERAGDKGAWSKVLKEQTNLQQHTLTKVTKELLRRQLIKEVKSVAHRGRKVFMLSEIEPDKSVSGGTWYHDGEFASGWIDSLRDNARDYIAQNRGKVTSLQELHTHLQQMPGPSAPTQDDVQAIMRTLELDEVVYAVQADNGQMMYLLRQRLEPMESFDLFAGRLPSWVVPVREDQKPQSSTCTYVLAPGHVGIGP